MINCMCTNFLPTATVVSFEQSAYTVGEDSVVFVCVQRSSSGIYPLVVFLRTVDVSAQGIALTP